MAADLAQLHAEFLQECEFSAKLRKETLRGYKAGFDLLQKLLPELTLDMLTTEMMAEFFRRMEKRDRIVGRGIHKRGVKNSTVATYRSKLNKFFDWLVMREYLKLNPLSKLPYPDVNYDDRKFLKREEVEKIFIAIGFNIQWGNVLVKKRNIAMFSVLMNCGLRKGELINLKILDLDIERRQLTVRAETSKSKRSRIIPLNSKVLMDIKDYLEERRKRKYETPYLLVSSTRDMKLTLDGLKHLIEKVSKASRVSFHAHQFRHTFAVNMLNQGCDIAKLKQLMGHTDIRMTAAYLRCLPSTAMREDVERLSLENFV